MSDPGESRHFRATTTASTSSSAPSDHSLPTITADPSTSLRNLTAVQTRIDAVRTFLSNSLTTQTLIKQKQMELISTEISSSIHQIIFNGTNLISTSQLPIVPIHLQSTQKTDPTRNLSGPDSSLPSSDDWETIELGSEELLAENAHFCEICGKGFKRDANLRMHMRAHGNQFKTPEALAKPEKFSNLGFKKIRFSCPSIGCNRNKCHNKFKPLKSVICVKNHFKRSHCPKTYECNRCNKKSFSIMVDLRNHLKHCGETKWKCSCGTNFSRKDKLFGHVALFEGHMPAIMEEDEKGKEVVDDEEVVTEGKELGMSVLDDGSYDRLVAGYDSVEDFCLEDMLNTPGGSGLGTEMDGLFDF